MATGGTTDVYKDLQEVTKCPICLETYVDPRSLPCIHVLCMNCLQSLVGTAQSAKRSKIKCPLCQKDAVIPTPPDQFPASFLINTLTDILQKSETSENVKCEPCLQDGEEAAASWVCLQCANLLCKHCKRSHDKFPKLKNHLCIEFQHLTPECIKEIAAQKTPNNCMKHDKELEYLCEDCQELLCVTCKLTAPEHKDHVTLYAKDKEVVEKHKSKLHKFNADCVQLSQEYKDCLQGVELKAGSNNSVIDKCITKVETRYNKMSAALKNHKDEIVQQINAFKTEFEVDKTEISLCINQKLEELTNLIQRTQCSENEGSYLDILNYAMQLSNFDQTLAAKPKNTLHNFVIKEQLTEDVTKIKTLFGKLEFQQTCTITASKVHEFPLGIKNAPTGLCLTPNSITISEYETNNILTYTPEGHLVSSFDTSGMLAMACQLVQDGELTYITDCKAGNVQVYSNGLYSRTIPAKVQKIRGIAILDNKLFLTSIQNSSIYAIDLGASNEKKYVFAKHNRMKEPRYICGKTKYVIASCSVSNNICMFDMEGRLQFLYEDIGLYGPLGVTTDSYSHIIVADRQNKRVVFLSGGQVCGVIPTEGHPNAVQMDVQGDIVVTTWEPRKVVKYSYQVQL